MSGSAEPGSPSQKRARGRGTGGTPRAGTLCGVDALLEGAIRNIVAEELRRQAPGHAASGNVPPPTGGEEEPATWASRVEFQQLRADLAAVRAEVDEIRVSLGAASARGAGDVAAAVAAMATAAAAAPEASGELLAGHLTLKVGSRKFVTTADTLRGVTGTFFETLVSGRVPQRRERDGSIFIDRNPKHFQYVLDYLRNCGEGFTPPTSKPAQDELRAEADFYGLPGLVAALRRHCVASNHLMTVGKKGAQLTGDRYAAALLDVRDPNNFSVTFDVQGWSSMPSAPPFFVGLVPSGTDLSEPWRKMTLQTPQSPDPTNWTALPADEVLVPPVFSQGVFFAVVWAKCQDQYGQHKQVLCRALTGEGETRQHLWIRNDYHEIHAVLMRFVREADWCFVEFGKFEFTAAKLEVDLTQHEFASTECRPAIFFAEPMSATVREIADGA